MSGREGVSRLVQDVTARDHAAGPEGAPLTLVEYGDYQCPFCAAAHPVVRAVRRALGPSLRFVFRNFPLIGAHPLAMSAACAAEAAALQGRFWEMHDRLFERQAQLAQESLPRWAGELGLDLARFERDRRDERVAERVRQDRRGGARSGVNGTPTFFINGLRHDGAASEAALLAALETEKTGRDT